VSRSIPPPRTSIAPLLAPALLLAAALAALLLGGMARDAVQRVPVGPGDEAALVGFYEREYNALGAFRWSRPGAALFLYGFDGRPALVSMRLNAARPADAPAQVAVRAGERPLGSFTTPSVWRRYMLLVPTDATGDTALYLGGDLFRVPGDERDLGVALSGAEARPALGRTPLPPLERTLFLATLPLLGWLLLSLLTGPGHGEERRPLFGPPLFAACALLPLVGWAAARPAQAGYLLPTFGWPWWPALPLALLAAWPWFSSRLPRPRLDAPPAWRALSRAEIAAVLSLTLAALGLRLVALGDLPLGLWRDEARHGLIALQIWQDPTYRPVYVVQGADLPALLFYLAAPAVGLLGPGVGSVRLVSALAGALTVPALWWAARPLIGSRGALLAAALLAWASWSLSMSRWAFPATLDQLLTLAAVGLAWRALGGRGAAGGGQNGSESRRTRGSGRWTAAVDRRSLAMLTLAGALGGLAAYAYHTGRFTPLLLAAIVAVRLGRDREEWRRAAPGLAAAVLVGLLVLAPLLRFVAEDFQGYNRRTGAVAFYNDQDAGIHAPPLLLLRNAERYLLMWHLAGDRNPRHHAPGAPMLDAVTGLLFAGGLALAALGRGRGVAGVLLLWLGLALVPGLLSTSAPHAMRSLPALAPACILAALALDRLLLRVGGRRALALGLASSALLASLALNGWLYFAAMPRDERVQEAFDTPETAMGRVVRAGQTAPDEGLRAVRVFLPASVRRSDVTRFLTAGASVGYFDAGEGLSQPAGDSALLLLPAGASPETQAAALAALGPGARQLDNPPRYPGGGPLLLAFGSGERAEALLRAAFK
jgi:4-amino-4-deoxy-L-arabinose transferase-like glycosyltransferase